MTSAIWHKTIMIKNACLSEFYVTNRAPSTNKSSTSWNESSLSTTDSLIFVFFSGWPINWNWEYRFAINCNCNSENAINWNCTSENAIHFPRLLQILKLIVIAVNMLAPMVSRQDLIYSVSISARHRESVFRDLHSTQVTDRAWFRLWLGWQRSEAKVYIRRIYSWDIHWVLGVRVRGGGGYTSAFKSWNMELIFQSGPIVGICRGGSDQPESIGHGIRWAAW